MNPLIAAFVIAPLLGSVGASAQTIFKSTMPDGKVIYGEKAAPGAVHVETLEPPPPKSGISGLTPEEKALAERLDRQRSAAAAASLASERNLNEARKQLVQAEAAREAGREPLPNERIGIAGGGSRLTEDYFARQRVLDEAVQAARKRLTDAQQALR
jgi:hypothetical protein